MEMFKIAIYCTFSNLFLHFCGVVQLILVVLVAYLSIPLLSLLLPLHLQF